MDRQINIMELQSTFPKQSTFENYRTILNSVNKNFGWETNVIYYDRMNNMAREIADYIYSNYKITNTAHYKQKMSALSSLMTRSKFGEDHLLKTMVCNANELLSVANNKIQQDIESWETLQPKLAELGKERSIRGIIAKIFSYGYVLRVGEIFETRIDADNDIDNYLDLDNGKWYIRKQKNGTQKTFSVDKELCDYLNTNCKQRCFGAVWLLSKANGTKYLKGCHRLPYHDWNLPCNSDIRKSYETWNRHESGRTEEEKLKWHEILGHTIGTVQTFYDQKAFDGGDEIIEVDPASLPRAPINPDKPTIKVIKPIKPKIKVKITPIKRSAVLK